MKRRSLYANLADLPEDERITVIGKQVQAGKLVAFITDNDAKADRYIEKLKKRFGAEVVARGKGPVKDTVYVKVRAVQQ